MIIRNLNRFKYCWNRIPKRKLKFVLILTGFFFSGFLLIAFFSRLLGSTRNFSAETKIQNDFSNNYFGPLKNWQTGKLLVNDVKCKIPDTASWEPSVQNLIDSSHLRKCRKSSPPNITYVDGNTIRINEALLHRLGHNSKNVNCCYRILEPVQQPFNEMDNFAYRYSSECHAMGAVTKPTNGLVKVACKNDSGEKPFYENFHALAVFSKENNSLEQKRTFWGKCIRGEIRSQEKSHACYTFSTSGLPPNILLLMLESTSRVNFRRCMHRTVNFLEETLVAVEMQGHTKVAENSYPHKLPMKYTNGMNCLPDSWAPIDNCLFIADRFSNENYLVGRYEDDTITVSTSSESPSCMRSLMVSGNLQNGWTPENPDYIGFQKRQELNLENALSLASQAVSHEVPYYINVRLGGEVLQEDMETMQLLDDIVANFLQKLHEKGLLKRTILFLAGDHGTRFGELRKTAVGWLEKRLPVLWIKLPDSINETNPAWSEAVEYNSKQLTTNFDIGATLLNIQQEFSILKEDDFDLYLEFEIQPERGLNLFRKLPERSCEDADIPVEYCACEAPVEFTENKTIIEQAGKAVVQYINQAFTSSCLKQVLHKIGFFGKISRDLKQFMFLQIETVPGNLEFEAYVKFNAENGTYTEVLQVLRISKILKKEVACLKMDECASAPYCFCDPNANPVGEC